jgi:uncharacterized protein
MNYLIDGHNLIGQCRTIRLDDPDDEARLVDALHRWVLRHPRHTVTVIFDGGVYGHPQQVSRPGVQAVFAHSPRDADDRLLHQLKRISDPKRYRLVTSDQRIATAARDRGVEVIRSEAFASEIERPSAARHRRPPPRSRPEPKQPRDEVEAWLREFGVDETLDG